MALFGDECDLLLKLTSVLENRLSVILGSPFPEADDSPDRGDSPEPTSELSGLIEQKVSLLKLARGRLEEILGRIDL